MFSKNKIFKTLKRLINI